MRIRLAEQDVWRRRHGTEGIEQHLNEDDDADATHDDAQQNGISA